MTTIAFAIDRTRYDAFRWRYELTIPKKLVLAVAMACLTGLLAQVRIALPWSPVPITGQTFAALLAGVLLGRWWGGASMAVYGGLGFAGLPWFTGWTSGFGATGGYIIGFVFAALFLGHFTDKYIKTRKFFPMLGLMLFASLILIYVPGLTWLGLWVNFVTGNHVPFTTLLTMGALPFIAGDIAKVVAAALIAKGVTPKRSYNEEADR
jgi:biotin transport system substrate-specific component